ncbi:NADPH:quinone oxidoreductase family protein [Comamonadaceae bacterium M7527]|nr:NADPH:quinone oxidoreductase family protein [Comamonadaceae bacterium M7527]
MHAWQCDNPTGVESLVWTELPDPQPNDDEVVVAIAAASLNFPDLLMVQNKYQIKPPVPFVPGAEFAGTITQVGKDVKHLQVGQAVACLAGTGAFATHTVAKAAMCLPLPPGFPMADAAAFIMAYATSHHALVDRGEIKAGDTVLILGAAGGVGSSAIQIAKAKGAFVVAAASSDEKCNFCKQLGADATINYSEHTPKEGLRNAIKTACNGKAPDIIYDPIGGEFAEPAFRSIAWRGRYLVVGFASGPIPALPLNLALLKGASIVGVFWGEFAKREPHANNAMMTELVQWTVAGTIKPPVEQSMPMTDLLKAFEVMSQRGVMGKLVLTN